MTEIVVPFVGTARHRINIDGKGVTTLAAFYGCPLICAYCINPHCKNTNNTLQYYTPKHYMTP